MAGLIGSMIGEGLAGAAQGLGVGAAKVGEKWTDAIHEREKQDAIAQREMNLAALNNAARKDIAEMQEKGAGARQQAGFTHTETMERDVRQPFEREQQEGRQAHATELQSLGFTHAENLLDARQKFDAEQNRLNRSLTREQIQSHERVAAANRANALELAKIGGAVSQDKDGNMLWVGKDGKASLVMDPSNPNQPLRGHKDMTPAAKQYAEVIKEQLKGLDKEEVAALDETQRERITKRRAFLNAELLNVLTGGIGEAGKGSPPQGAPSQSDIEILKRNPSAKALFDQKFGAGAADKILGQKPGIVARTQEPKQQTIPEITRQIGVITEQLKDPKLRDSDRQSLQAALQTLSAQIIAQNK